MDTPAFQYLLSLFPQLTLRQRRVAQQELLAPHAMTSLNTQLPACRGCPHCQADAAQLAPWGWSLYAATVANCVCAPALC